MSKMKKTLLMIITFLLTLTLYSQEIEKIGETRELVHYSRMNIYCPSDIFVDEVNNFLYCQTNSGKKQSKYNILICFTNSKIAQQQRLKILINQVIIL